MSPLDFGRSLRGELARKVSLENQSTASEEKDDGDDKPATTNSKPIRLESVGAGRRAGGKAEAGRPPD